MIWELDGIEVGHWSDHEARTGCTVVRCDPAVVASGEVRGSAPATRDFSLLDPAATVQRVDAVVLSGGSAFGLAAVDGVMEWCEAEGRGVDTPGGRVPIVVAMSLFDLAVGDAGVRPAAGEGRLAATSAPSVELGAVGAGTGATTSSWRGPERLRPGGLVGALQRDGDLLVACLVAVNAWGDVRGDGSDGEADPDLGDALAFDGARHGAPGAAVGSGNAGAAPGTNTTIGVVATNATIDKLGCLHLARGAHDGLARAVTPPHSSFDGDAFVALSTGEVAAPLDLVRLAAVRCVDRAIRTLWAPR